MHHSRSHDPVIRVYDATSNMIETHEHAGELRGGAFTFVPENWARKVTAALPPMRDRRYFSNPDGFNFETLQRYELEKIRAPRLRGSMRFRGLDCYSADEGAR